MADERIPELIADLEDHLTACLLREVSMDHAQAALIARKAARHVTNNWGGQIIYIPKNHGSQLSERDRKIWQEFNGKNHAALARKYHLTVQQVYNIIRSQGARERAKNQSDMFS